MKRLLLALCALLAPAAADPSLAARWEPYGSGKDGAKCFYSPLSIIEDRGIAKVWERSLGARADIKKGVSEARTLTEFDCAQRRYRVLLTVTYPIDKSRPLTVKDQEQGDQWKTIAPESLNDALAKEVCSRRQQQQARQQAPVAGKSHQSKGPNLLKQ